MWPAVPGEPGPLAAKGGVTIDHLAAPIPRAEDGSPSLEGRDGDEETFLRVLEQVVAALEADGVAYAFVGGVASATFGRPRWTHDVDVMVRPDGADRALDALAGAGFQTQRTDSFWLYKGVKEDVLVDVIFRSSGDIYLDEEMVVRTMVREFKGRKLRVVAPEDLVVIKAVVHDEKTPRHWYDALGILARGEIDWEYLVHRGRRATRRVLSLLFYAQSNDIAVPGPSSAPSWTWCTSRRPREGGEVAAERREPEQYLMERVREALAEDPRVGELYVTVTIAGDKIFLSGSVATEQRREAMDEVVREIAPDLAVCNQTTVNPRAEPPEAEKLP